MFIHKDGVGHPYQHSKAGHQGWGIIDSGNGFITLRNNDLLSFHPSTKYALTGAVWNLI